ncbi:MAG TPA: hypothetical protein VLP43_00365 [Solirubrobacteraceae bacterium]|nr:hypothetical protein [Solirubrobacteraceae bacterium]
MLTHRLADRRRGLGRLHTVAEAVDHRGQHRRPLVIHHAQVAADHLAGERALREGPVHESHLTAPI